MYLYHTELSHVFKNGLKAQKLLAQGNRPGYNSSQQSALKGQKLYKLSGI